MIVFGAGIVVSNRLMGDLVENYFKIQSPTWILFMVYAFAITVVSTAFGAVFMLASTKKENQVQEDEEDEEDEGDE